MLNSFHITAAVDMLRANGFAAYAAIFVSRPFNRSTVVAALRQLGEHTLADAIDARLMMHRELVAS